MSTIKKRRISTADLCYIGVMSAISVVLSLTLKIPMAFLAPWLKLDLSFVPVMLTGFALGPVSGLIVLTITNVIHLFVSDSAMVGQLADFLLGLCFMLPASLIYRRQHTRRGALVGMIVGSACMIVGGILSNLYLLLPLFLGADYAQKLVSVGFSSVSNCVIAAVIPFNLIKGVVVSAVTFVLYKRLSRLLHRAQQKEGNRK